MNENFSNRPALHLIINGQPYDWHEEYIRGIEIKDLGHIRPEDPLFLVIEKPWEDELILNETRVNLARPGIEQFISREKHEDTIILTIETTKGKWENAAFHKRLTINHLIEKVVKKFEFEPDGNFQLRVKGQSQNLPKEVTLESLHLKDHSVLVFIDLGKGACL